jgi:hypothetical protein
MKCAFCRKTADARVDIGGQIVPVCAKHFGNHDIKAIPVHVQTEADCDAIESMHNMATAAGIGGLD